MIVALVALALGGSPSANLTITVWPQGTAHAPRSWTLRCAPPGGTLPRGAAACRKLSAFSGNPFAPVPPATACSMIYGGPQVARIRGTFRGRSVAARFTRVNGCEVGRWRRLAFLFPVRL